MLIDPKVYPYLRGDKFDIYFYVKFIFEPDDFIYKSRNDLLTSLSKDKNIIHVGCVDHNLENINKKLSKGEWLHKILCENAKRCFGVDIQEEGIRHLVENLSFKDVAILNIEADNNPELSNNIWDYMFIPDVIEHLDNPIEFLSSIHERYKKNVNCVVITVPNAFISSNLKNARQGIECINSDHRFWFTPYTLMKLVVLAGFTIKRLHMCKHGAINKPRFFYPMKCRYPLIRESIVMEINF